MPMAGIMVAMTDEVVDSIPGLVPGNMVALQYALGLARQSGVSEPEDSRADSLSAQPNVHIDALATIDSSAGLRSAASADTTSFLTSPVVVVSPRDSGAAIDADGAPLETAINAIGQYPGGGTHRASVALSVSLPHIPLTDLQFRMWIGEGSFGKVSKAWWSGHGLVAVKSSGVMSNDRCVLQRSVLSRWQRK